jgi:hypothetical protein
MDMLPLIRVHELEQFVDLMPLKQFMDLITLKQFMGLITLKQFMGLITLEQFTTYYGNMLSENIDDRFDLIYCG